jgi:outer membrane lipoprotein
MRRAGLGGQARYIVSWTQRYVGYCVSAYFVSLGDTTERPVHDWRRAPFPTITMARQSFHLEAAFLGSFLATLGLLSGCASGVPVTIRNAPSSEVSVAQVRDGGVQQYTGTYVRWGGSIAVVENGPSETLIQVVSQPLAQGGRPKASGDGGDRFLAKFPGFVDPLIYDKGRQLTVVGTLRGEISRKIGQFAYILPVVEVQSHHLWEGARHSNCNASNWWRCDCCRYSYYRYAWPYGPYCW